ncbi:MAG: hypothetical protein ACQES0_05695 [Bacteroidota bacterium]
MMRKFSISVLLLFVAFLSFAEQDKWQAGSRSSGMGDASLMNQDVWAGFNNPGALTGVSDMSLGLNWENQFMVNELSRASLAFVKPFSNSAVGVSFSRFGYSLYSENRLSVAYSMQLAEWLSMGVQLNYFNTMQAEAYGNTNLLTFDIGLLATPGEDFMFGAHVFNPANIAFSGEQNRELPVAMRLGVGYWFSEDMLASVEAETDMADYTMVKVGFEHRLLDNFFLRTGINAKPLKASFGVGWKWKNLSIDLAYSYHNILGSSPHLGVSYAL